jgi:hypothetical protein
MFVRALGDDEGNSIKTLETYLLDRGWPDDHQFEAAFVEFSLYRRGYTREILETLEQARGHKEPANLQAAQVEHVLPQTLSDAWHEALGSDAERIHADWLDRPGNLTLSAYNQELWNHPFEIKRERYAQSNVALTRELADFDHWGEAEIRERGHLLAIEAAKMWTGPKDRCHDLSLKPESMTTDLADLNCVGGFGPVSMTFWLRSVPIFLTLRRGRAGRSGCRLASGTSASSFDWDCATIMLASTSGSGARHRCRYGRASACRRSYTTNLSLRHGALSR